MDDDLAELIAEVGPSLLDYCDRIDAEEEAAACEASLYYYLQRAWQHFDPAQFIDAWHLRAMAEHLEAVSNGEIRKLLITVPPRSSKTSLVTIAWPTWTWACSAAEGYPLLGPGVRFLCASYGATKAQQDAVTARRLIGSQWYQRLWGQRYQIEKSRDNQEIYDTDKGGSRISTGIPESLGKGGAIRVLDDPQKADEVESEKVREGVIRAYDEIWRTRSNDPKQGAEVIIMQRLADNDIAGHVLGDGDWVHLNLPMRYDPMRHCETVIGFSDPRTEEGELLWPARFDEDWARQQEQAMGPYAWANQMQQLPQPRGGGIIQTHWWQPWPPTGEEEVWTTQRQLPDGRIVTRPLFPDFDLVLGSVDGAFTEDEANDWCAMTVWGTFQDRLNRPRVMMIAAWRERLELHRFVMRIIDTCKRRQVDRLLIENKASGRSAAQETRRLMADEEFGIELIEPKGDKSARLLAIQPLFSGGVVYAPFIEPDGYEWVNMVVDEVAAVPRGSHDDLADTASQALNWLRRNGFARLPSELDAEDVRRALFVGGKQGTVAESYGI